MIKKRLLRTAENVAQQQVLQTLAQTGREIIQNMENWKYNLIQAVNICKNTEDEESMRQNFDMVDKGMSIIANTCIFLENAELLPSHIDTEQFNTSEQSNDDYNLGEEEPLEEIEDIEPQPSEEENAEGEESEGEGGDTGASDDGGGMDFNFG